MTCADDRMAVEEFARRLSDLIEREERRRVTMATVERVVAGRSDDGQQWFVTPYRSTEVRAGHQLVGLGGIFDPQEWPPPGAAFDRELFEYWWGVIDEPPGTELLERDLVDGQIAWWHRNAGWSATTGPVGVASPPTFCQIFGSSAT